ncbi:MAG: chloride channel protein [Gammaproteobacteria bacterium]|nr:chloride channel protein [Gammaproteobacteria bacterium]
MILERLKSRLRHAVSGGERASVWDGIEDLPLLTAIAAAIGIVVGLLVAGFRAFIDLGLSYLPRLNAQEHFQLFGQLHHFVLPVVGALIAVLLLAALGKSSRVVGVVHVMERFSSSDVRMPLRNTVYQFLGGSLALIFGISGGREGPAIHLGASASSWIAHRLRLPHNAVRVLVACGIASGIAASFDVPIASVVFTVEVIMMEYTIATFLPLMLAAFTSTFLVQQIYPYEPIFPVSTYTLSNYWELPYIVALGVAIGIVASFFKYATELVAEVKTGEIWHRMMTAGILTGAVALVFPQVLGMGWETASLLLSETTEPIANPIWIILALVIAKIVVTSACVGSGLPVGIIGPSIVIGVMLGVLGGDVGRLLVPTGDASDPAFYALLGTVAMLSAVLNAPLAALLTVVELSANHHVVLPGLLAIVAATLTTYVLYGRKSIFVQRLHALGISYPPSPSVQFLRRNSIAASMNARIAITESKDEALSHIVKEQPKEVSTEKAEWVVEWQSHDSARVYEVSTAPKSLHGICVPIISSRSSLEEALTLMNQKDVDLVCASERRTPNGIIGVLTRSAIENLQTQSPRPTQSGNRSSS